MEGKDGAKDRTILFVNLQALSREYGDLNWKLVLQSVVGTDIPVHYYMPWVRGQETFLQNIQEAGLPLTDQTMFFHRGERDRRSPIEWTWQTVLQLSQELFFPEGYKVQVIDLDAGTLNPAWQRAVPVIDQRPRAYRSVTQFLTDNKNVGNLVCQRGIVL